MLLTFAQTILFYMKKLTLVFFCVLSAMSTLTFGQVRGGGRSSDYDPMEKPNIVKLNLSSLAYKNIALQYERVLGEKISVALGVRFMPKGALPLTKSIDNAASGDSASFSDWKAGSFAITPEFRFYPKHAGKGFYLAPYLRYRNVSMDFPIDYTDDNGGAQKISVTGNASSFMGGLMIGSQFNLGKMVTLDWFIIGVQYGVTNGKMDIKTTQTLSASDQTDIRNDLDDFKETLNAFNDFSYTVGANGGSISGKFGAVGFRGFGLNLGFKF